MTNFFPYKGDFEVVGFRSQMLAARSRWLVSRQCYVSWEAALQGALVEIPLVEELADLLGDARVRLRLRILRLNRIPQLAQQKLSPPCRIESIPLPVRHRHQ